MFGFAKMRMVQFAGDGEGIMRGNVLGLLATEGQSDGGMRAHIVAVYDELRPLLYSNLVFLGFDPNEADDVIQEAFLGLVRQLGAGRKINDVRGWIFRASYSLSLNVQRKERRIILRGTEAEAYTDRLPALGLNPEQQFLFKEQTRRYEAAIERLTGQQRDCLLLRKEGLRYREIAAALNISASRVPQLLERAVGRVMEELYG